MSVDSNSDWVFLYWDEPIFEKEEKEKEDEKD